MERIPERPSISQATTIVSDFYAAKRRPPGKRKKAFRKEPSEITLSSSDEQEAEPSATSLRSGAFTG